MRREREPLMGCFPCHACGRAALSRACSLFPDVAPPQAARNSPPPGRCLLPEQLGRLPSLTSLSCLSGLSVALLMLLEFIAIPFVTLRDGKVW